MVRALQFTLATLLLCCGVLVCAQQAIALDSTLIFKILGPTQCVDGIDNDGDGFIDFPADPDCSSYTDDDEIRFETQVTGGGSGGGSGITPSTRIFISGKTFPGGSVAVLRDGIIVYEGAVGLQGVFDIRLADLPSGPSIFMVFAKDAAGRQAAPVTSAIFLPEGVITQLSGLDLTASVQPVASGACPVLADFNNDCAVNLLDMSIAAFWWNKELTGDFVSVERVKLNGDGKITIEDFSLIAFYWTG